MFDLLVIGAGMAGATAAHVARLSRPEWRVAVVWRAPGESALSSGTLAVAGEPHPPAAAAPGVDEGDFGAYALGHALAAEPGAHPYQAVLRLLAAAGGGEAAPDWRAPVAEMIAALDGLYLPLSEAVNRAWLTAFGTFTPAATAQATMALAHRGALASGVTLFAGFRGFQDLRPEAAARVASHLLMAGGVFGADARVVPFWLPLPGLEQAWEIEAFQVARLLEEDAAAREIVLAALASEVARARADRVILPAVLGISRWRDLLAEFAARAGCPVSEALATGASVPGLRLLRALEALLVRDGIETWRGDAVSYEAVGGRVVAVMVEEAEGQRRRVEAARFLIATGKHVGGGIVSDPTPREPLFSLPVFAPAGAAPVGRAQPGDLTNPDPLRPQPIFGVGARVDARMRPVDATGRAAWSNLFAAGSLLGGYDYISDKIGLGAAILTGWAAVEAMEA
ncbi:MAG: FAD-binding protein [Planctomycetes bacterium]|nr:FAD-binding protein [Planctomycetota bacterium]